MEDHESSSTGMIIGMIIGGVVVLALVVVGAGFFWARSHQEFAAVAAPEVVVGGGPQAVDEGPQVVWPLEDVMLDPKFDKTHKFLFGAWTGKLPDGGEASLQFGPGNRLEVAASRPGDDKALGVVGRWNIVADDSKRAQFNYFTPSGAQSGHHLVWEADGFRFQSSRTAEDVPIKLSGTNLDGVVFQRRKEQPK